jgi:hypothetical protein
MRKLIERLRRRIRAERGVGIAAQPSVVRLRSA